MSHANGHTNGLAPHNDTTWVLAFDGGRQLVGQLATLATVVGQAPRDLPYRLSPVFDFGVQIAQPAPGQIQIQHVANPVLMLPGFDSWDLSTSAVVKPLSELAPEERASIMQAIENARRMVQQMRAARLGIHLASGSERLPPLPRG